MPVSSNAPSESGRPTRRGRHRSRIGRVHMVRRLLVLVAVAAVAVSLWAREATEDRRALTVSHRPPPPEGYFRTAPVGSWAALPDDRRCQALVHRSTWEPRPGNQRPNTTVPDARAVRTALASRPRGGDMNGYDPRFDSWLLARVTGRHTGTTDENIQWAACKWGLPDNVLRAIAVRESTWHQDLRYPSGRCVLNFGCGDMVERATADTEKFCAAISGFGHDFEQDFGVGRCPKTFSLVGVMAWQDPGWGPMEDNQNGTFPFAQRSTAYALDYLGAFLRGCYEGWVRWLGNTGDGSYAPGDLDGCVGAWYAGDWRTELALGYVERVRDELAARTWLTAEFRFHTPPCSATYGCPQGP